MVNTCYSRTWRVKARESGVQGHPQLYSKLDASLDASEDYIKEKNKYVKVGTLKQRKFPNRQIPEHLISL